MDARHQLRSHPQMDWFLHPTMIFIRNLNTPTTWNADGPLRFLEKRLHSYIWNPQQHVDAFSNVSTCRIFWCRSTQFLNGKLHLWPPKDFLSVEEYPRSNKLARKAAGSEDVSSDLLFGTNQDEQANPNVYTAWHLASSLSRPILGCF